MRPPTDAGYLSAGALALILAELLEGRALREAIVAAQTELPLWPGHEETSEWIERALLFAEGAITPQTIDGFGAGWVGEEALAIALACTLKAAEFSHGVKLAVNHSGDSDSTGQIAGAILGLIHGVEGIPARTLEELELREQIELVADALYEHFGA